MAFGFSAGSFERLSEGLYRIRLDSGFESAHFATGLEKLAFEVLYCLFTTQGSVPDDPEFGTQLRSFVGQLSMGGDEAKIAGVIAAEVYKAESQVKSRQASATLPPSERLKRLVLDSIEIDHAEQQVNFNLIIVNELDQAVGLAVPEIGVG